MNNLRVLIPTPISVKYKYTRRIQVIYMALNMARGRARNV